MRKLYSGLLLCLFSVLLTLWGNSQTTYNFTTAGASGRMGPTQTQVNAAYPAGNTLHSQVTISTQGIQEWTVPATGLYAITAAGASGGYTPAVAGGKGRVITTHVELTAGQVIQVLVGQEGGRVQFSVGYCGGGGGGSFVVNKTANAPILIAGGGGGATQGSAPEGAADIAGVDASPYNVTNGQNGTVRTPTGQVGIGGVNGAGGGGSGGTGGGGYTGNGMQGSWGGTAGLSFVNGGAGGANVNHYGTTISNLEGGFGGGAGAGYHASYESNGGGGGGYSGGGGSGYRTGSGGGGGNFYTGTYMSSGLNIGPGYVTIVRLFSGGTVTADQTLCGSGTPTLFASSAPASGSPVAGYQWQVSTDGNNWSDIASATNLTYQAPAISQTTYYRRKATATDNSIAYSNTLTITVNPIPAFNPAGFGRTVCNGETISLDPATGGTLAGATYNWTNNNTTIGLAASGSGPISFTTTNTGAATSSATITVTPTAAGCAGTPQTFSIAVKPTPTVNAVGNQTVCHNSNTTAITFSGAVAGTTYSWTNSNPTIGLAANGTGNITAFTAINTTGAPVTATITVTPDAEGCVGQAKTFTITVNPLPETTISGGNFCKTGSHQLTVSGQAGGTFSAQAGLNITANGMIDLANSTAGTYTVTYAFSNGLCSNTTTSSVTVNSLPTAAISGTATVCQNAAAPQVTFTGSNGTAPYTFSYKLNGGALQTLTTTSGNAVSVSAPTGTAGTYTYELVSVKDASTTACATTATGSATVTVTPTPTASFSYSGTPYCASGTAAATFSGTSGGTYTAPAGVSINATTGAINLAASTPGTYTVTYTIAPAGGCSQYTTTATVTVRALTAITTQPAAQTVCENAPVTLSVTATGNGTLSYQWRKDGATIANANTAAYYIPHAGLSDAGSYEVIVTGECGAVTSTAVTITVNPTPATPVITASGALTFCQGESVTLTSSGATGNQWFKDGVAIAGATGQTYTVTTSGHYTAQTTQLNCKSAMSLPTTVTVKALPAKPTISAVGNVLSSSAPTANQWFLNGVVINGATGNTHRVQSAGLYTVRVTENGCSSLSDAYNFVATRIDNPASWNGEIVIYPNPVHKTLFIKNSAGRKLQVQFYDAFGKKVYETKLAATEGTVSVENWASGVYQVVITDLGRNETISQTIIKL